MESITSDGGTRKRILGRSGTAVITPMTVTICGNNAEVGGDSNRRYISVRMVNRTAGLAFERSEFRHDDILGWVRANRSKLLAALHTILAHGLKHKVPLAKLPSGYGSFEQWSEVVLGSLSYVKLGDRSADAVFDDGRREFVETNDDEGDEWAPLMEAWLKTYGTRTWATAKEARKKFSQLGQGAIDLPMVLLPTAGMSDANQAKTWGRALSARRSTSVLSDGKVLKFEIHRDPKHGNKFKIAAEVDLKSGTSQLTGPPAVTRMPRSAAVAVSVAPVVAVTTEPTPGVEHDFQVTDLEAA